MASKTAPRPSIAPLHPGELLREDILPALDITRAAFAEALGVSRQTVQRILAETAPVTPEMAVRLGKVCGNGAGLWLRLQTAYDLAAAEREVDVSDLPTLSAA